jgi:hypothetical protein
LGVQSSSSKGSIPQSEKNSNQSDYFLVIGDYPSEEDYSLPELPSLVTEKINEFLTKYKAHNKKILDTVIRRNFPEVQILITQFWEEIPIDSHSLLNSNTCVNLIGACDCFLFKAIDSFFFPSITNPKNLEYQSNLEKFCSHFESYRKTANINFPKSLTPNKRSMEHKFCNYLKRQLSLSRLSSQVRTIMNNDHLKVMIEDWKSLDLRTIIQEAASFTISAMEKDREHLCPNSSSIKAAIDAAEMFAKDMKPPFSFESFLEKFYSLLHASIVYVSTDFALSVLSEIHN